MVLIEDAVAQVEAHALRKIFGKKDLGKREDAFHQRSGQNETGKEEENLNRVEREERFHARCRAALIGLSLLSAQRLVNDAADQARNDETE